MTDSNVVPEVIPEGTPTQVAHKARTAWRTFVQAVVWLLPVFLASPEILTAISEAEFLPEGFRLWAAGAAVFLSGLIALAARIMATEGVNRTLEKAGALRLGTGVETEIGYNN